ncbi:MAG: hypothetical protein RLO12_23640 [Fulvivirga sp.]
MNEIYIIVISAFTATLTTIVVELIKSRIQRSSKKKTDAEENIRKHDIALFKVLSNLLQEGILRGTMFSIKVNAEYYFEYINGVSQYEIYTEDIEESRFIDQEIEKTHRNFLKSLKNFEKDLFEDFSYYSNKTYRPNKEKGYGKSFIKEKYTPLTDKVLEDYTVFRKLVKKKYQV